MELSKRYRADQFIREVASLSADVEQLQELAQEQATTCRKQTALLSAQALEIERLRAALLQLVQDCERSADDGEGPQHDLTAAYAALDRHKSD